MTKKTQKSVKKTNDSQAVASAARLIGAKIEGLGDWRGEMLSRLRALIRKAEPEIV
jgi:hypothetical protein